MKWWMIQLLHSFLRHQNKQLLRNRLKKFKNLLVFAIYLNSDLLVMVHYITTMFLTPNRLIIIIISCTGHKIPFLWRIMVAFFFDYCEWLSRISETTIFHIGTVCWAIRCNYLSCTWITFTFRVIASISCREENFYWKSTRNVRMNITILTELRNNITEKFCGDIKNCVFILFRWKYVTQHIFRILK